MSQFPLTIHSNKIVPANYIFRKIYTSRSIPRAQTSTTPSLKSVKQITETWNSVARWFLCPYPEKIQENPSIRYFPDVAKKHGPRK